MKKLIPQFGEACLQSRGDAFTTLARSIVGQQISVKAAQSVWDRFAALTAGAVDAHRAGRGARARRAAHARRRPVGAQGRVPVRPGRCTSSRARCTCASGSEMDDEAIIDELVAIRGIGRWTAEMFLIFHLMRPNVLPLDDLGLHQGHQRQLLQRRAGRRAEAREVGDAWAPYCSRSPLGTFGAASTRCRSPTDERAATNKETP